MGSLNAKNIHLFWYAQFYNKLLKVLQLYFVCILINEYSSSRLAILKHLITKNALILLVNLLMWVLYKWSIVVIAIYDKAVDDVCGKIKGTGSLHKNSCCLGNHGYIKCSITLRNIKRFIIIKLQVVVHLSNV